MGLQSQRRTKSSKKRRASHFALKKVNFSLCPHCHQPIQSHHVCRHCGYYKGKQAIKVKSRSDKKSKASTKGRSGGKK